MALPSNAHLNVHAFIGYCRHDYIALGVPTIWNFIDFDVLNGTTGLFAWPTASFPFPPSRKPDRGEVLDIGLPMEGRGTDATLIVPHVPWPLVPSVLLPLIILFGSSKIIMGSNRTRIWCKGLTGLTGEVEQAVGCCMIPYYPVSFNLQCWDLKCKKYDMTIGAPMLSDVVIAPNTVQVGVSFSDYLAAMMDWAIDVALAVLIAVAGKLGGKWWSNHKKAGLAEATAKGKNTYKAAKIVGMSDEAAERLEKEAFEKAMKSWHDPISKPLSKAYGRIAAKEGGEKWLIALGGKVPYKLLVKNTEWYREDVQQPIEKKLPKKLW